MWIYPVFWKELQEILYLWRYILYFYEVMLKDMTIFNLDLYYFLTLKKLSIQLFIIKLCRLSFKCTFQYILC